MEGSLWVRNESHSLVEFRTWVLNSAGRDVCRNANLVCIPADSTPILGKGVEFGNKDLRLLCDDDNEEGQVRFQRYVQLGKDLMANAGD